MLGLAQDVWSSPGDSVTCRSVSRRFEFRPNTSIDNEKSSSLSLRQHLQQLLLIGQLQLLLEKNGLLGCSSTFAQLESGWHRRGTGLRLRGLVQGG